jgi:hypothetical protein
MAKLKEIKAAATGGDPMADMQDTRWEYIVSKYIRSNNTRENAKYLGYIDGRELYPDFYQTTFSEYLDELLDGERHKPYGNRWS